jgi:hypothetical protein
MNKFKSRAKKNIKKSCLTHKTGFPYKNGSFRVSMYRKNLIIITLTGANIINESKHQSKFPLFI